ncbi:hypothetical protein EGW08_002080 [Elysia chlorotica]|uniref:C2 domain-containing protein n=1 Tax=Elysia chlorotica TaxID=188477 RepID=A0A433U8R7_ELYCH|nr:hypothetical protein EGW08_002080 [Elysia chlorotica]
MEQVMQDTRHDKTLEENKTHVAMLLVFLDSAMNLPRGRKTLQEPSPQAVLSVGQQEMQSSVRPNTNEPRWEESFRFMLHNPNYQNLEVEIKDTKSKKPIGGTLVKLKELLIEEDMVMDQKFHIKTSEGDSYVNMRLALRILTPNANPEWIDVDDKLIEEVPKDAGSSVDSQTEEVAAKSAANGSSVDQAKKRSNLQESRLGEDEGETTVSERIDRVQAAPQPESSGLRQRSVVKNEAGEFGLGRIQMTFRYSQGRERLVIVVHKCSCLRPVEGDSKNLADPYVRMYLLPDKSSSSKKKTKVIKDDLNPVFDETFEYSVSETELGTPHAGGDGQERGGHVLLVQDVHGGAAAGPQHSGREPRGHQLV